MLVLSADTITTMLDADLVSPAGVSVFNQFILSLFFRNKLLEFSAKVHHKFFTSVAANVSSKLYSFARFLCINWTNCV